MEGSLLWEYMFGREALSLALEKMYTLLGGSLETSIPSLPHLLFPLQMYFCGVKKEKEMWGLETRQKGWKGIYIGFDERESDPTFSCL